MGERERKAYVIRNLELTYLPQVTGIFWNQAVEGPLAIPEVCMQNINLLAPTTFSLVYHMYPVYIAS